MMHFFAWLEETGFSTWLRESTPGFFGALTVHSLAMGLVVGINLMLALRLLGLASSIPPARMLQFFALMWGGVVAILLSGLLLLLAYPAKALTNWVFFLKLGCVIAGLMLARHFSRHLRLTGDALQTSPQTRQFATLSLLLWIGAITAGRFLAYTHTILLAYRYY